MTLDGYHSLQAGQRCAKPLQPERSDFGDSRLTPSAPVETLQAGGRGGTGNVLYCFRSDHPPVVLKVYRPRRSRIREFLKDVSERLLEGKRGATAARRCATERLSIDLWAGGGFDVVQRLERPQPSGLTFPALWLAHYSAPRLSDVLTDRRHPMAAKLSLVELLGASLSRRHTRAVELREPLLVHEHGNIKHFFVEGERLVAFDLEHGYRSGYPVIKAVAREIAGIACSLVRADAAAADQFLRALVAGYTNKPLLEQAVRETVHGGGLIGAIRRWRERRRPGNFTKTRVADRFAALLEGHAGNLPPAPPPGVLVSPAGFFAGSR